MICGKGICAKIGPNQVLNSIDVAISTGELLAVIGANGAGKTSLLRALSGMLSLSQGSVMFDGQDIKKVPAYVLPKLGLVHVPQGRQIIPGITVKDNLLIGAQNIGTKKEVLNDLLAQQFERFPVLKTRQHIAGGSLSGGEQQMLAIARGLMMQPKLLLLDEPSLGLAPKVVELIMETLRGLAAQGLAIILVEQVAMMALSYADRAIVLRNGSCVEQGSAQHLLHSPDLINSYLS